MRRYLCFVVTSHDQRQRRDVEHGEVDLCQRNVASRIGNGVQTSVYVQMHGGIHERPGRAVDLAVIPLTSDILFDLLHVSDPVNLGICAIMSILTPISEHGYILQATVRIIRPQSTASASNSAGATYLDHFGSEAKARAR